MSDDIFMAYIVFLKYNGKVVRSNTYGNSEVLDIVGRDGGFVAETIMIVGKYEVRFGDLNRYR